MIAAPLQASSGLVSHTGATLLLREGAILTVVVDLVLIATVMERRRQLSSPRSQPRSGKPTVTVVAAGRDLVTLFSPRSLAPQPPRPAPAPAPPAPATGSSPEPAPRPEKVRLPAADGLRGLAAILVVLFHTVYASGLPRLGGWRTFLRSGYMGVDFFFVLSGFVLFLPVALANGKFGSRATYTVRRVTRILPAFYLAVFATLLLHPYLTHGFQKLALSSPPVWKNLLLHLTFLQHSVGLAMGYPEGFGVNGAVWTLSIEVVFYILLPFVAFWYYRRPFIGLAVALAGSIVWKYEVIHGGITLSHTAGAPTVAIGKVILITQFPSYVAHFAIGMTGAWIYVKLRSSKGWQVPVAGVALQLAGLAGVIWGMVFYGHRDQTKVAGILDHWVWTTPVALAFGVLLLGTLLAPKLARTPFANPVVRWLGKISYGIYLFHLLFLYYAMNRLHFALNGTPADFLHLLEFTLGGAIVAGALSYYLVERPLVGWARRFSDRRAARHAPAPVPVPVLERAGILPGPLPASFPAHALAATGRVPAPAVSAAPPMASSGAPKLSWSSLFGTLGREAVSPNRAPAPAVSVPVSVVQPAANLANPFSFKGAVAANGNGNGYHTVGEASVLQAVIHPGGNGNGHPAGNGNGHLSVHGNGSGHPAGNGIGHGPDHEGSWAEVPLRRSHVGSDAP